MKKKTSKVKLTKSDEEIQGLLYKINKRFLDSSKQKLRQLEDKLDKYKLMKKKTEVK